MMIVVRPAVPGDERFVCDVLEEMDRFYGTWTPQPEDQRLCQVHDALFGASRCSQALLAWEEDGVAGIATYSYLWPAVGVSRALYLKELFVCGTARRRGVGTLLMRSVFDAARDAGCCRVEWHAELNNHGAHAFYARFADPHEPSRILYRCKP
jgi:GNAT superfamily N-acetyltransferase